MKITSSDQLAVVINTLVAMYNYQVTKIEDEKSLVFGIKETTAGFHVKATWIKTEKHSPVNDISDGNVPIAYDEGTHIVVVGEKDHFERLYDFIIDVLDMVAESEIEVIHKP